MNKPIGSFSLTAGILAILAAAMISGCSSRTTPIFAPYPVKGTLTQTLNSFDNPEGAIFSSDGRFVFISNSAELGMPEKGFHWVENGGYISKLEVQPDGTLKMVSDRLVTGLTGPMGMAVLPVATGKFPAGTIFVCTGGCSLAQADGTPIKDQRRLDTKLVAFGPDGGALLGEIRMAAGSAFAKASGAPVAQPNALAFDAPGNLYVTDTGNGGASLKPKLKAKPGIYQVPHESLDALAQGQEPANAPRFVPLPGGPDGIEMCPADRSIHVNTVGMAAGVEDWAKGGMYRLTDYYFEKGKAPEPFARGLGALDGLIFVAGKRIDTQVMPQKAILVTPQDEMPARLVTTPSIGFTSGGADIAALQLPDGSKLLIVPDPCWLSPNDGKNPVYVVKLPARF